MQIKHNVGLPVIGESEEDLTEAQITEAVQQALSGQE
jgi:hypothetical protein